MDMNALQVRMLGGLSLRLGDQEINDSDNRSRKVWLLLAYMICCRTRPISQEEFIGLLWGEEGSANPTNALKTIFHRLRTSLNQLDAAAGRTLILRKEGTYAWNTDVSFFFDVDQFESLCRAGTETEDEETQLRCCREALDLYQGDFLPKLSSEPWVLPISAYYHNLYIQTLLTVLPLLERRGHWDEMVSLCRRAVGIEPYQETIYQHLMQALLALGRQREVITLYDEVSQLLFDNFGVMPAEEIRALYREAIRFTNDHAISLSTLREQLREPDSLPGALVCDYDFFRVIYHAVARSLARSGDAVHIGLISVSDKDGEELSKRSLERCMENLQEIIRGGLRKGDVAARCSVSQYVLMLPQANYENSCMVCGRIIRTFSRQYPHSPAQLHFSVQPLEPNV